MPSCPDSVKQLIEQFTRHRDDYHTGRYNETQLRRDYLDPFFKALGWDIDNEKGYAEAYREVIHEDAIKIGGTTKAPDYSFRIGGQRKFFVEAKKPSINLKSDPGPALQVRRYAWTAKLPISVLTDFEEFALYDCRKPPKAKDKAHTARLDYFTYDQIPEKWDEIAGLLSPQAIQQGAFDKYASKRKTKGTADVDDVFLDQLESWRQDLAKHLIRENQSLTQRQLNHAVQLIIDRIVFLRICEDRGIEQAGTLLALTNGTHVYDRLQERFRAADAKYNSGLFHFQPETGREDPDTITPGLAVGDRPLKAILKNLYPPESPYEFSVLPADILGQVYERFLGSIITLSSTGKTATVEEKPEVRKAGGVYYTPRYIVDYIVEQTVGELLKDRKLAPKGRGKNKLPAMNKPLTVLDPACGSGSFLLGAFDHLLNWHLDYYVNNDPEAWAELPHPPIAIRARKDDQTGQITMRFTSGGDWKLTTTEKKRILLEHLYGVDIDAQAVEVTKLSLLLKVLEGENEETVQRSLFAKERALPDLSNNIKCGNSLIGTDFYDGQQMGMFSEDDLYRINAFDWETEFAGIMQNGGFDAVIGNPPYIKESMNRHLFQEIRQSRLNKYALGKQDIWYIFACHSIDLTCDGGLHSFIATNNWPTSAGAKRLRAKVRSECQLLRFIDFGPFMVFDDASIQTMIYVLRKSPLTNAPGIEVCRVKSRDIPLEKLISFLRCKTNSEDLDAFEAYPLDGQEDKAFTLISRDSDDFTDQIKSRANFSLKSHELTQGIVPNPDVVSKRAFNKIDANIRSQNRISVGDPVFVVPNDFFDRLEAAELIFLKPTHDPADCDRYFMPREARRRIIYLTSNNDPGGLPSIDSHLNRYRAIMEARRENQNGRINYRQLHWPREERYFAEGPKILSVRKCLRPTCVYTESEAYVMMAFNVIRTSRIDLQYLTGLLNSRLMWFWLLKQGKMQGTHLQIDTEPLLNLPIYVSDNLSKHDHMVTLVQTMLDLNRQLHGDGVSEAVAAGPKRRALEGQIAATDRQIDELVYELYGLTDEEIAIVEEATR